APSWIARTKRSPVSTLTVPSQAQVPTLFNIPALGSAESAWDVLDRLGEALQPYDRPSAQVRHVLEAVQASLGADALSGFPGSGSGIPDWVGQPRQSTEWRRDFTCREVARMSDQQGQFVRTFLDSESKPSSPWPCSAAFVRVRQSRGSWLVALS